jgi:hypothetical protein
VRFSTWNILANITMFQTALGQPGVIGPYWTLIIELTFYGMCAVLFALRLLSDWRALLAAWAALLLLSIGLSAYGRMSGHYLSANLPLNMSLMFLGAILRRWTLEGDSNIARWSPAILVFAFASVPVILKNGGEWFLNLGKPNNGGSKLFSVSGHVEKPGNYEIPLGTPFPDLLKLAGGMRSGRRLKAVIPGGSSTPVLRGEVMMGLTMDYDSIAKAGSMLGAGSVIVMDDTTCMVNVLARISHFYYEESCGQCTPCREGTGWLARVIHRIAHGQGRPEDLDLLVQTAGKIEGRTICALGDAAAMPVTSFIRHFRDEFEDHINLRRCRVAAA